MKKFLSVWLAIVLIVSLFPFSGVVIAAGSEQKLNINWEHIKGVGHQTPYTQSCACFAVAYCRTMLDGKVHYWYEYDSNGGKYGESGASARWGNGSYVKGAKSTVQGTLKAVYDQINSGRPAILHVKGGRSTGQHWVAVVGYQNVTDANNLSYSNFLIIDSVASKYQLENLATIGYSLLYTSGTGYQYVYTNSGKVSSTGTGTPIPDGLVKEEYRTHCEVTVSKDCTIKSLPCSPSTNADSEAIEDAKQGDVYEAVFMYRNTATSTGNLWYQVKTKNGRIGYLFAGNTDPNSVNQLATDVTIDSPVVPSAIVQGNDFVIGGTVKTQYQTLIEVGAWVDDANGAFAIGEAENISASTYSLKGSTIDTSVNFATLPAGQYYYSVGALVKTYFASSETTVSYKSTTVDVLDSIKFSVIKEVPPSGVYATIATGNYFVTNNGTGRYLCVSEGKDVNNQNIGAGIYDASVAQTFEITPSTTTAGYMMRPLCSVSRVVNVYGNTVSSGNDVCLWDDTGHNSQRWNFEAVDGGYVIRNVQNPSCVLTVQSNYEVKVQTYIGANTQIWTLESLNCTHTYDNACDATCNSCGEERNTEHNYVAATCTKPATCTVCGVTQGSTLSHTYDNSCDTDCNVCGELRDATHDFVLTIQEATCKEYAKSCYTCKVCGYSYEEIIEKYTSDWSTEYPADVDEELIESKTEYRYREWKETTEPLTEDGWILDSTYTRMGEYGAWSTWSNSSITGNDNTQVETRTVYPYYYFKCPNCGAHMHVYLGCYTWAGGCGKSGINSSHYVQIDSTVSYSSAGLQDFHGTGRNYTYIDGQLVFQHRDGSKTQYRSRTRELETVYKYYCYTDWADWSEECNAPDAMAEERTVYRYAIANFADHTYDDDYDADCNVCGAVRDTQIVHGDANEDGAVNARDAALLQQFVAGWDVTLTEASADANGDGSVNARDAALLQQYVAGWDVELR